MDTYSNPFIDYLQSAGQVYPSMFVLKADRQRFDSEAKRFIMSDDVLYRIHPHTADKQLYVPLSLRDNILSAMHNDASAGHLGAKRTVDKLAVRFWWEGMAADTHRHIQSCTECLRYKVSRHHGIVPMGNLPIPTEPFEFIAVDFLGPLPKTKLRNNNILVITDYLTRWAEAIALPNQQARTYANAIIEHIILRHGAPRVLLSDNAKDFTGLIASEIYELFKIKKVKSSAYRPQTNGLTERLNHTLVTMLSNYVDENQTDWDIYLPYVMCAYRSATQETVKHSPFYLLYGREPRLPIDALLPVANTHNTFVSPVEYVREVQRRMQIAHHSVKKELTDIRQSRIDHNNQLNELKLIHFNIGDVVMKRVHQVRAGVTAKLSPKWTGRFKVIDKLANGINYGIHPVDDLDRFKNQSASEIVHGSELKLVPSEATTNEENINNVLPETHTQQVSTQPIISPTLQTSSLTQPSAPPMFATSSGESKSTDSETAAMHPDHREKLPTRMAKRVREDLSVGVRRSARGNKGQMTRPDGFADSSYMDYDDDDEFKGKSKSYEFDE